MVSRSWTKTRLSPSDASGLRFGTYVGTMEIQPGDRVQVVNARGERHDRIAVTGVIQGGDFPVVRITSIGEYDSATREQREPESVAWPMEDVFLLQAVQ